MPDLPDVECAVLGAGPAGVAAALKLRALGHRVVVIDRGANRAEERLEVLTPGALSVLSALGLTLPGEAVRIAVRRVAWPAPMLTLDASGAHVVERADLAAILRNALTAEGIALLRPARASRPRQGPEGIWRVAWRAATGTGQIRARCVLVATGRAAWGLGRTSVRSLVISARLPARPWPAAEMSVEALPDAWLWMAPAHRDRGAAVQLFVDAAALAASGPAALLHASLRDSRLARGLQAVPDPRPRCFDATPRTGAAVLGVDCFAVGDAALAHDPLSSQGIQAALVSGMQAAIAIHTNMVRPERHALVERFLRSRHQERIAAHFRLLGEAYGAVGSVGNHSFWRSRAAECRRAPRPAGDARSPEGRAAGLPHRRLRLASEAHLEPVPVVVGDLVEELPALRHPTHARDIAFVGGVPIGALLEPVARGASAMRVDAFWRHLLGARATAELWRTLSGKGIMQVSGRGADLL